MIRKIHQIIKSILPSQLAARNSDKHAMLWRSSNAFRSQNPITLQLTTLMEHLAVVDCYGITCFRATWRLQCPIVCLCVSRVVVEGNFLGSLRCLEGVARVPLLIMQRFSTRLFPIDVNENDRKPYWKSGTNLSFKLERLQYYEMQQWLISRLEGSWQWDGYSLLFVGLLSHLNLFSSLGT